MVNINGKEWAKLEPMDIQTVISEQDFDESFFFEFKDDKVSTKKLMEEVSAFANTFGGYIFIGVSDDKQIEGCTSWNEQRIHTALHDSITPTPSFDVKKFTCNTKIVYVIKIDEGIEPPYITSSGKICERLSSGSFTIKDSAKLSQIYNKREQLLAKRERKISIPPIPEKLSNIYGYIDIGFDLVISDISAAYSAFDNVDLKSVANQMSSKMKSFSLTHVGNSIVYTPGGLSSQKGQLPAHANNFLEIMPDGSARMRIILMNNDQEDPSVNMVYASTWLDLYQELYVSVMGDLLSDKMIYAKKYESLTVLKQFNPTWFYDSDVLELRPELEEKNQKMLTDRQKHQAIMGIDMVVTDDRVPKTGLYTIDKSQMEKWGVEYTLESIADELFYSSFVRLGVVAPLEDEDEQ